MRILRGFVLGVATTASVLATSVLLPAPAMAREVMTDRCRRSVVFPHIYDEAQPTSADFFVDRGVTHITKWTPVFKVKTDSSGHIRWYCRGPLGNPNWWNAWTAERSRCGDHSTRIRVRLGLNRLVQIECMGQ